jgi:hypothetical protein
MLKADDAELVNVDAEVERGIKPDDEVGMLYRPLRTGGGGR